MPRRAKGPRLYLDPKRRTWAVRDGTIFVRTGIGERDNSAAEKFLAQYIGRKHQPQRSGAPLIADMLTVYGRDVAPQLKSARDVSYRMGTLLRWWGDKTAADISIRTCKEYASTRPTQGAGNDLKVLKGAIDYWHRSEYGPLNFTPVFWRPKANPPKDRWMTRQEVARLLRAAKPYPHLRRFILIALYTGSRPGVVLALTWDQVDLVHRTLRRTLSAEDAKKRAPPVRLGNRILAHLRRWKKLDGAHIRFICNLDGHAVRIPRKSWHKTVASAGIKGITRHTLRHTRSTWLAQAGVPLWEAAGFLGMTTKTLERVYAHHHPDAQERAANTR